MTAFELVLTLVSLVAVRVFFHFFWKWANSITEYMDTYLGMNTGAMDNKTLELHRLLGAALRTTTRKAICGCLISAGSIMILVAINTTLMNFGLLFVLLYFSVGIFVSIIRFTKQYNAAQARLDERNRKL